MRHVADVEAEGKHKADRRGCGFVAFLSFIICIFLYILRVALCLFVVASCYRNGMEGGEGGG